ncbi:hypothetical protein AX16_006564 [Volvariella volvacea WC 439]|nr:hypothetical protein AX16_006564 [Volvariella volvacea WC 439]
MPTAPSTLPQPPAPSAPRKLLRRQPSAAARKKRIPEKLPLGNDNKHDDEFPLPIPPQSKSNHPYGHAHSRSGSGGSVSLQRRAVLLWKWLSQAAFCRKSQRYSYMPPGFVKVELGHESTTSLESMATRASHGKKDARKGYQ